jgi:hypothetical protein
LNSTEERKGLLYDAFKPSKVANAEGELVEGSPTVTPPVLIALVKTFIEGFGNINSGGFDLMARAQSIIDEAQFVATELFGESMTPRDQQKFMFEKKTMSIWDLADFEDQVK